MGPIYLTATSEQERYVQNLTIPYFKTALKSTLYFHLPLTALIFLVVTLQQRPGARDFSFSGQYYIAYTWLAVGEQTVYP